MSRLFISHAFADKKLVDRFVDQLLRVGMGVPDDDIFYSSGVNTGVPSGEDLSAYVRSKTAGAELVVAIVTPAFARSPYCIAELGAAWARAGALFPLLHPGMDRGDLGGVLRGVLVRTMSDSAALDELYDRVCEVLGLKSNVRRWGASKGAWLSELPAIVESLKEAQAQAENVPATVPRDSDAFDL